MRGFSKVVGIGLVVASLGVAFGQVVQWHQDGVWKWIPVGALWEEFGGSEPLDMRVTEHSGSALMMWFLGLPLVPVLFGAGAFLATSARVGRGFTS